MCLSVSRRKRTQASPNVAEASLVVENRSLSGEKRAVIVLTARGFEFSDCFLVPLAAR